MWCNQFISASETRDLIMSVGNIAAVVA